MPLVSTWLNKSEFKDFQKDAEKNHRKLYCHHQIVLREGIARNNEAYKKKAVVVRMSIIYGFTIYSLIAAVIVLVF